MSGWNYSQAPPYGQPPGYGTPGYAPPGMPPQGGMGPPPGMPPPGMPSSGSPGAYSPFQAPPSMPNINFSAPVIRLGTSGPQSGISKPESPATPGTGYRRDGNPEPHGGRRGLGFEGRGDRVLREVPNMPPTYEEKMRTIAVIDIVEPFTNDDVLERILNVGRGLRRWVRVSDVHNNPWTMGFAEYEDVDSLATAIAVLVNVTLPEQKPNTNGANTGDGNGDVEMKNGADSSPVVKQERDDMQEDGDEMGNGDHKPAVKEEGHSVKEDSDDGDKAGKSDFNEDKKPKIILKISVDNLSREYIQGWRDRGSMKDPAEAQVRIDTAKEDLARLLHAWANPQSSGMTNGELGYHEVELVTNTETGEIVTIPIKQDDELSDIPKEMREQVRQEIEAFRQRSNARDLERLKQEEHMEQKERRRQLEARLNPHSRPEGAPLGPRRAGAALGQKESDKSELDQDYVKFGRQHLRPITDGEAKSDATEQELLEKRQTERDSELHAKFEAEVRKWSSREEGKFKGAQRERKTQEREEASLPRAIKATNEYYNNWTADDDPSTIHRLRSEHQAYYRDRVAWLRDYHYFRDKETQEDAKDRADEEKEIAEAEDTRRRQMGAADEFLAQQATAMEAAKNAPHPQERFQLSLGAAAQRAKEKEQKAQHMVTGIENMLNDEEEEERKKPLKLRRLEDDGYTAPEEDGVPPMHKLVREIPLDKEGLFGWNVAWGNLDKEILYEKLRPYVEKQILAAIGLQEDMLVDAIINGMRDHMKPQAIADDIGKALEDVDEAEELVRKTWRMLIFYTEADKRGIS